MKIKTNAKKIFSLLLSLVMLLGSVQVFAGEIDADSADVYVTVSVEGVLAADSDGGAMAYRRVTVTDIDGDGRLTVDEALMSAHAAYNSEDGYSAVSTDYGLSVERLWGVNTYNTLFFINDTALSVGVGSDEVKDGDRLTASVNKDNVYYADWYCFFDSVQKTVKTGEEFSLTLKGHLGMAYSEEDKADTALSGVSVGVWKDGAFEDCGEKTDADGKVSLSFDKAGTYCVSAYGTVKDTVTDWSNGGVETEADCPIIAPFCIVTIENLPQSEQAPYFESLEFTATAFNSGVWVEGSTFAPTKTQYDLPLKNYSTSTLSLKSSTLYDTEKYTAYAEYTDVNGAEQRVYINSGKATSLTNQPFGNSVMTITVEEKDNAENKTVYTFNVTRPRDTSKALKTGGITLSATDRELYEQTYNGVAEGTMQRADENGSLTSGTGVSGTVFYYRAFVYDDVQSVKLNLASSTVYAHIRYSTDGGSSWRETAQGGGLTDTITLSETADGLVLIQLTDDFSYSENVKAGNDGFYGAEPVEYRLWIDAVSMQKLQILSAETNCGDWYPAFSPDAYSYWIVTENTSDAPELTFDVTENCDVKIGSELTAPNDDGKYTLKLGTSASSVTVTSQDGSFSATYKFGYRKKSAFDVPDRVVDYLCIGSQYTNNASFGANPEQTLSGSLKSLGNFGGYITYYYEEPITDNPNNKYGMDFYVIGNGNESNMDSMAELGQVYISEDGESWYALAGSEHYESKAVWDYTITYVKGDDGKSYWTDNRGNSIDYAAAAWPKSAVYYMNDAAKNDEYSFTGIVFESQLGSITGDSSSTSSFAAKAKFGYADYYASNISGTTLADVNPYVQNPSKANGFDVAWAVDKDGTPIDVSGMEFHYIKIATASNIYAGGFKEKSTEVSYVVRTTAQEHEVGKTNSPESVTVSDGANSVTLGFSENQNVYTVNVRNMKYVSVKVNGTSDGDNIYINNTRVSSEEAADGFKVTKENGETLIRVIVQNGDCEPIIYLLKLVGTASESDEIIEGVKICADGAVREAKTKTAGVYTSSVGYRISSVGIMPVVSPDVSYTVNGKEPLESYELEYGKNVFEISAANKDGKVDSVTLTVTRESAPSSSGKNITVYFTLYGDEKHGAELVHTYKSGKSGLALWIPKQTYSVPAEWTVSDVLEKALAEANMTWTYDGGNYISEINGLSEFDNGALSGWMYMRNGKYSELGVAEQTLKNGDSIIFHYTDDYTKEQNAEAVISSSGSSSSETEYTVKFDTDGAGEINSLTVVKNGTVSRPDDPIKDGFEFDGWYTDKGLTEKYDFSAKVTSGFTLYAKWTKKSDGVEDEQTDDEKPQNGGAWFTDVEKGSWYEQAVGYVVENNLFKGTSETEFAPERAMTRAMLVTVLYRLENPAEKAYECVFDDVKSGEWYADAVAWAAENEIVTGISETEFAPEQSITREQAATVIYRYAKMKGMALDKSAELSQFEDVGNVSGWALEALSRLNAAGLIKGTGENTLSPRDILTRAQTAQLLMRFCEMNNE